MTVAAKQKQGPLTFSPLLWKLLGLSLFGSVALLTMLEVSQSTGNPWRATEELRITDRDRHRCPNFPHWPEPELRLGDHRQTMDYGGQGQQVVKLPTSNSDFLMTLEYNTRVCNAFKLTISREDNFACGAVGAPRNHTSIDLPQDLWMEEDRGPDSFMIKTEGAEAYTTEWHRYLGRCTYEYSIELQNAGVFWLQVWWMYQSYDAFNELKSETPEVKLQQLLPEPLRLDICDSACRPVRVDRLNPQKELHIVSTKARPQHIKGFFKNFLPSKGYEDPVLPSCEGKIPTRGIYAPAHFLDTLDTYSSDLTEKSRYRFVPGGCVWNHAGRRFVDHKACTSRPKEVLMLGDGHVEELFEGLVHRLGGSVESFAEQDTKADRQSSIGHLNVTYKWEEYGTVLVHKDCSYWEKYDAVVLGIGSSHAMHGKTTKEYGKDIPFLLTRFVHCESGYGKPLDIIFIQAPAHIPHNPSSESKDLSTNTKLQHWRDLTYPIVVETGWHYIDYFELTMPFVLGQWRKGRRDFRGTEANEVAIDEIIGKSGICDTLADRAKKGRP